MRDPIGTICDRVGISDKRQLVPQLYLWRARPSSLGELPLRMIFRGHSSRRSKRSDPHRRQAVRHNRGVGGDRAARRSQAQGLSPRGAGLQPESSSGRIIEPATSSSPAGARHEVETRMRSASVALPYACDSDCQWAYAGDPLRTECRSIGPSASVSSRFLTRDVVYNRGAVQGPPSGPKAPQDTGATGRQMQPGLAYTWPCV
jgi:hypothetical protein